MKRLAVVLVVAAVGFGGGWLVNGWRMSSTYNAEKAQAAEKHAEAVEQARAEERRRVLVVQEVADAAQTQLDQAQADAGRARDAAERLRQRVAQLVAAARNPTAPRPGQAADDPIGVLADVLGRADQRAGVLAEYADRARIAGHACERAYDALTPAR